jgi:predicted lipoprotein with Yx(FWY)xxD motif/predicted small secreted protein
MFRKQAVYLAAFVTAGAALLAACGTTEGAPQAAAPAPSAAQAGGVDQALNLLSGTAKSNKADLTKGDLAKGPSGTSDDAEPQAKRAWIQLKASKAGELNPVVVNGAGRTVYRFDKDTAKPSKSTCNGDCAVTWPPLLVGPGSRIFVAGVKASAVGIVTRDDGTRQVTIGGWPAYLFTKDKKAGDTFGQGVGGTWFGMKPNGQKSVGAAGAEPAASAPPASTPPADVQPATSAVLFDDANFSDNGASQGVATPPTGCRDVSRAAVASSVSVNGSLKIWTGPNCTGKSQVITEDVPDLSTIGFDNAITSVFFGTPTTGGARPLTSNAVGAATELTATSAILNSGKNLSEPNGSQGVSGPGCANVLRPAEVSSIRAVGTYKIWTGANCTGTSKIVDGDVLDLEPLGFDKKVASIRFAG